MRFRRWLIFGILVSVMVFVLLRGDNLPLAYLVTLAFFFFPFFYFFHREERVLLALTILSLIIFLSLGYARYKQYEIFLLALGMGALTGVLYYYRGLWITQVDREIAGRKKSHEELEMLRQKHQTREESLMRLEKQVTSLMELFEIARDFSESITYETLARLLREKIMPELPCSKLEFAVLGADASRLTVQRFFSIGDEVEEIDPESPSLDLDQIRTCHEQKQILKFKIPFDSNRDDSEVFERWLFPLVIEDRVVAVLTVEAGSPEDFVRYEVLVSHLVLQVKKIELYETVRELSIVDSLTEVYVRRHFLERFREEVQRSMKYNLPFCVLMLDIDHFKRYNDQFGHLVGDATLKAVALMLRQSLRKVDIIARYGGEEFIAVLPETTSQGAQEVAERIRSGIARHKFHVYDVETRVTVSIGISFFPDDIPEEHKNRYYSDLEFDLIRFADKALYRAKEEGRNRVYRYQDL